jgi:hypothetical protein
MPKQSKAARPSASSDGSHRKPGKSAPADSKPAPSKTAAPSRRRRASASPMVSITAPNVDAAHLETGPALQRAAMQWSWVVRNRARWAGQPDSVADQSSRSREQLRALGLDRAVIDKLASADLIQVNVPYVDEPTAWEARVFPWEYVLSTVNRDPLAKRPLIVRRLVIEGASSDATDNPAPDPTLIVVSAPGTLREIFSFEEERGLVESNLVGVEIGSSADESDIDVRAKVAALKPMAIHLAGVDSYQGAALLGLPTPERDGYLMADSRGVPRAIAAEPLAKILTAGGRLRLVACNFWNSGTRTAAMAVASGSEAAIGFQDQVDDSVAELFFARFYTNWRSGGWMIGPAFERTLQDLKKSGVSLKGTGVVLWSSRDLLADRRTGEAGGDSPLVASAQPRVEPISASTRRTRAPAWSARDALSVEARPLTRINYSLLHNDQAIFDTFRIRKQVPDVVRGVEIEVVLYVGGDSYPYRTTIDIKEPVTDLRDRIRVPLTSTVLQAFRESVRSVIYVGAKVGDEMIFQDTWRITLVPVEEWTDDDEGGRWLPSYVLPRDPAVATVVDAAYPLIRTLREGGEQAFDGYQEVQPDAPGDAKYRTVDAQVKALWSALSFQFGLRYINPPPTYSPQAQRLRTPSEVLRSRSGTCIDLALLLASCLEYIDIYPVLFLLPGHALPGYWRDENLHAAFRRVAIPTTTALANKPGPALSAAVAAHDAAPSPWLLRTHSDWNGPVYAELDARLVAGDVIPLETVAMTDQTAFTPARKLARQTLDRNIESMVDVQIARLSGITPLPMDRT